MPLKFKIAESYLNEQLEEDEQRVFNPKSSTEAEFREFMVTLFLNQQSENAELSEKVATLTEKVVQLERDNAAAHLHRDTEITELRSENADLLTENNQLNRKVSTLENKYIVLHDRSLDQERHSRGFNLRFPDFKECITREDRQKEDCVAKVKAKLASVGLGDVYIENAHRVGPETTTLQDRPRQIIARFLYRPERRLVWMKRKQLWDLGCRMFEDLCKPDLDRKVKYAKDIEKLFKEGKRVWFSRGFYYVNNVKQTAMV